MAVDCKLVSELLLLKVDAMRSALLFRWRVGRECLTIQEAGKNPMELFEAVGLQSKRDMQQCMRFAALFSWEDIASINKGPGKKSITWPHVNLVLAEYLRKPEKLQWLKAAKKNSWSATEMYKRIKAAHIDDIVVKRSGWKKAVKSLAELRTQVHKFASDFEEQCAKVWIPFITGDKADSAAITEFAELLVKHQTAVFDIVKTLKK